MLFFKEQRLGPTNPILHYVCHLWNKAGIEGQAIARPIDVTGDWHDAGDYLKFVTTTSYTTYLLIFAYDFDNKKFGFDNNNSTVPNVLEEAKIGLDWLLRCNYKPNALITRVQDFRDHSVKWRIPENDLMKFEREGSKYHTKSEAGLYSATLALAAEVWDRKFRNKTFSEAYIKSAKNIYYRRDSLPEIKEYYSLMYRETNYYGEFELAATE